ncbi:MAG: radical SAM protein [Candidatus Absconditabacterales bacterium]|nr:radical SAM protein [Candidatus Absconditabacterales bacterium]
MNKYQKLVLEIIDLNSQKEITLDEFKNIKRKFSKENKLSNIPTNIKLIRAYHQLLKEKKISKNIEIENLFKKRGVRSESGIVAVQVLTKPYFCPGQCIFCPNEVGMPKSYISTEPGAMRAFLNQFDPIKQTYNRLISLTMTGHQTDKIEMIVLGGTWDVYPQDYKIDFIKSLYDACNTFSQLEIDLPSDKLDLSGDENKNQKRYSYDILNLDKMRYSSNIQEAIKINETANHRIIGLTVETRPEFITDVNCKFWRELGVTRLEIGVQSMYDDVLLANKRGHDVKQIRKGIHKLRQYGFKFSIHIMPGLYKSDYSKDLGTFEKIYSDPFIKPDEIKFYPTSVIPNTELYQLYLAGNYRPLTIEHIQNLIKETFENIIPSYTRIKRLIRDIPSHEIAAGSNITNLSQLTHNELLEEFRNNPESAKKLYSRLYCNYQLFDSFEEFITFCLKQKNLNLENGNINTYIIGQDPDLETYRKFVCLDTRSREIRHKPKFKNSQEKDSVNLIIRQYESSAGIEYFLSFEDLQGYIYGFTRLLLPKESETIDWEGLGKQTALIRELHIYGQLASLKENIKSSYKKQHKGFGSQIMFIAEQISKSFGYQRLSVISGVGVRGFFKKIGYSLDGTYMVKSL